MTIEIRPYQDAMQEGFDNSGLNDDDFDDYAEGWNEQHESESLQEMSPEDYQNRLDDGIPTEIINFNGLMVLYEQKEYNGLMKDYVVQQMMTGYAPHTIGIGYEVIIIDEAPLPLHPDYVVISSNDLVDMKVAAPLVFSAGGHWCMYMRRENLKHYLPPAIIDEQIEYITQNDLEGTVSEVEHEAYEKPDWLEMAGLDVKSEDTVANRGQLCVYVKTGEQKYMETPTKGWAIVQNRKLFGQPCQTTLPALHQLLTQEDVESKMVDDTELMIECKTAKETQQISDALSQWDFFYVSVDGTTIGVYY